MKKRLLVIISMAVVMLVGASVAASAEGTPVLKIWNGEEYKTLTTPGQESGSMKAPGTGSYSYDSSTNTLTLDNITFEPTSSIHTDFAFIQADNFQQLTINLVGNNKISIQNTASAEIFDSDEGCDKLIITGTGTLVGKAHNCIQNDDGSIFVNSANLSLDYLGGAIVGREVFINGASNVYCTCGEYCNMAIIAYEGKVSFNLSKGGKVSLYGWVAPISAVGGIAFEGNSKITSPKGASQIMGGWEYSMGYIVVDANGNIVNEVTIEYVENATGVNTADNAPMIIFAVMAMLVILGTTTVLLKKQR